MQDAFLLVSRRLSSVYSQTQRLISRPCYLVLGFGGCIPDSSRQVNVFICNEPTLWFTNASPLPKAASAALAPAAILCLNSRTSPTPSDSGGVTLSASPPSPSCMKVPCGCADAPPSLAKAAAVHSSSCPCIFVTPYRYCVCGCSLCCRRHLGRPGRCQSRSIRGRRRASGAPEHEELPREGGGWGGGEGGAMVAVADVE